MVIDPIVMPLFLPMRIAILDHDSKTNTINYITYILYVWCIYLYKYIHNLKKKTQPQTQPQPQPQTQQQQLFVRMPSYLKFIQLLLKLINQVFPTRGHASARGDILDVLQDVRQAVGRKG